MFYAMRTIKDSFNPKIMYTRAIRIKPFKSLVIAKKVAAKYEMGYVINHKREIIALA